VIISFFSSAYYFIYYRFCFRVYRFLLLSPSWAKGAALLTPLADDGAWLVFSASGFTRFLILLGHVLFGVHSLASVVACLAGSGKSYATKSVVDWFTVSG